MSQSETEAEFFRRKLYRDRIDSEGRALLFRLNLIAVGLEKFFTEADDCLAEAGLGADEIVRALDDDPSLVLSPATQELFNVWKLLPRSEELLEIMPKEAVEAA